MSGKRNVFETSNFEAFSKVIDMCIKNGYTFTSEFENELWVVHFTGGF